MRIMMFQLDIFCFKRFPQPFVKIGAARLAKTCAKHKP